MKGHVLVKYMYQDLLKIANLSCTVAWLMPGVLLDFGWFEKKRKSASHLRRTKDLIGMSVKGTPRINTQPDTFMMNEKRDERDELNTVRGGGAVRPYS